MGVKLSSWIKAARLRTLPLALSCTLAGTALAASKGAFDWKVFVLAALTTILLQVLSNFANDYGDFQKGTDQKADRQDRALASGEITASQMKSALYIFSGLSFISGVSLLAVSFSSQELLKVGAMLLLGLGAIWAAIKYTSGENAYGYRGLGDLFVFLFFGIVGVIGTQYLYTRDILWMDFLLAVVIGGLSVAVLNLNNLRDIHSDKEAGKITIPVRLGFARAKLYHVVIFCDVWMSLGLYSYFNFNRWLAVLVLPLLLHVVHLRKVFKENEPQNLDPELKKIALSTFFVAIVLLVTVF